eukprot:Em0011g757a
MTAYDYTEMKPEDETYDTIDDIKVAVRTALTLSRSKVEIKLQEAQDNESPILDRREARKPSGSVPFEDIISLRNQQDSAFS